VGSGVWEKRPPREWVEIVVVFSHSPPPTPHPHPPMYFSRRAGDPLTKGESSNPVGARPSRCVCRPRFEGSRPKQPRAFREFLNQFPCLPVCPRFELVLAESVDNVARTRSL